MLQSSAVYSSKSQIVGSRGHLLEDVLERALEFYKDRHPKQQGFVFLHCWHLLKEVPRWWQSAQDIQRRGSGGGGASAAGAADQQPHGSGDLGDAVDEEEVAASQAATGGGGARTIFPSRPARPQGSKAAKADLHEQSRRDAILKTQALAAEQMAKANMRKAEAMGDHAAMSLFRTPIEDVDEDAREYFKL
jgi:hypothetical protein